LTGRNSSTILSQDNKSIFDFKSQKIQWQIELRFHQQKPIAARREPGSASDPAATIQNVLTEAVDKVASQFEGGQGKESTKSESSASATTTVKMPETEPPIVETCVSDESDTIGTILDKSVHVDHSAAFTSKSC